MKNEEFELLLKGVAVKLKNQFSDLAILQQKFIDESSKDGKMGILLTGFDNSLISL